MSYKSIATVVTDSETNEAALRAAVKLTGDQQAHLDVLCLGIDHTQPGFYYAGANALVLQDNLVSAQNEAQELERLISARLNKEPIRWSVDALTVQTVSLTSAVAHHTRLTDLVVLPKPYGPGRGHEAEAILEATMFEGQVPVLVIPDGAEWPEQIDSIVVAWNESTEALDAIRAALPLLQAAGSVNIAIIDPPPHGPDRSDPGGQLSQMLVRHGVKAEVSVLARTMPRVSDILIRHSADRDADLLVMGAYGHSRFRESILGGATRNMLEMSEIPVLLAH